MTDAKGAERTATPPARDPRHWWRHGVLYQIYPRSYQDSNGDGVGDLPGITSRLDHLGGRSDSLGIDGIWISPFYPSPMADFGYDVADYCDVDPTFGTLADFDELLDQAHERGIRIIVDLVPNHSSSEHPWFRESRSSRTNAKRDWYVWRDPGPHGEPPNNWKSTFSRVQDSAWTLDPSTGQMYLHSFLPEQPDLNWANPEVRRAFDGILRFWLDRGVDGFRIDVAHMMAKDPDLRDNPVPAPGQDWLDFLRSARMFNADQPAVHDILRSWRRTLDSYGRDRMDVGEVYLLDPKRMVEYYGSGADELDLAFNFSFLRAPFSADAFRRSVEEFEALLPPDAWPDYTLSNHDHPRAVSRYAPGEDLARGRRRARLLMLMLLTLRGTPFLYQGEEIAMADGPVPPDRIVDVDGRDPERTPMQWDDGPSGGFTTGAPWLPVSPESRIVNVEAQRDDPRSMLAFTRSLIALRRGTPALTAGVYSTVRGAPDGTYLYERRIGTERWRVALNFGTEPVSVELDGIVRASSDPDRAVGEPASGRFELGPEAGVLVEVRTS
ncbi:MAG TPA: alpha-amylase family glycosyl hydrolase [Candidatus Limnocylindrales bacterium]|nr:alpha-amylase family glycosyl hydrolase [Candidatus Limnocylindrales bacterium]